jgi:3-dehydroquinate synthase
MNTLSIDLGSRSYDILIGHDILKDAGNHIAHLLPIPNVIIITDNQVAPRYLEILEQSLKVHAIHTEHVILKAGESSKSFATLEWLTDQVFNFKPERKTTLIALGGGVVGDLTGFVASIVLRGIPFIQIPTTLLAQVDSSVGGKTGINNRYGKNLIGSFYQPRRVLIDVNCLKSLPQRQFLAGYAEVVKYGLIKEPQFFEWLETNRERILAQDHETLQHMVSVSCKVKADIVASDEKENNIRALLNLGHTFGHALEAVTGYSDLLLHGEGVAIGMVMAAQLSVKLGLCHADEANKIIHHLQQVGLPTSLKDISFKWQIEPIIEAMEQDKKVSEGKMVFVVLDHLGKASLKNTIDRTLIRQVLQESLA